jgi:hypothetical protein
MAKFTERSLPPDHPIFSEGSMIFAPMSRPSTDASQTSTGGENAASPPETEEQLATEWNALRLERYRRLQERLASTGSLAPTQPSSPSQNAMQPNEESRSADRPNTQM